MDNSFLTWLKSAVIFGVVFGLSGCDKLNSQKSINTETDEQPTQSQSIKQENTSKPNRTLLTRAFTHPPSFEPWFVRYADVLCVTLNNANIIFKNLSIRY